MESEAPKLSASLRERLAQPLQIGKFLVRSRVFQSPLSGVTDKVFRRLVRRFAPRSLMYTEMVNATGLHYASALPRIMEVDPNETPIGIQLFDCRPHFLAEAARMAVEEGADVVDINMGCPVNKITKNGGGSSLLRDPKTAADIVKAVVDAVDRPVTVKTRLGWTEDTIDIINFARQMEDAGAQLLTLHGRTRAQGYNGPADWSWIGEVKQHLTIPVIANGDIFSVEAAIRCLEQTGADGVMCARGTLGHPFLVGEIDHYLKTGNYLDAPSAIARLELAKDHVVGLWDYKGQSGIRQSRKHMTWYAKDFPGAAGFRQELCRIESVEQAHEILDRAIAHCRELGLDSTNVPEPELAAV